jgi:predicted acyl esterase
MHTSSADPNSADGAATDPIAHMNVCLTESPDIIDPGAVYRTWQVPAGGFTLLGLPSLSVGYTLQGRDATIGFKLWDVASDGTKTLVTRAAYRLSVAGGDPAQGTISVQLFGNGWFFAPGHLVRLQISQADPPYLRPDNLASAIDFSTLRLVLPTREPGTRVLRPAPG